MHIIKLNAIDSTNTYLRKISSLSSIKDYTVVVANRQTNGRGHLGTIWDSQSGKNLTMSVFKDTSTFPVKHPFFISIITSLSILKALQAYSIPRVKIKWPNDILSEDKKVCGILIENVIKRQKLTASIIGIGLNVNQTEFNDLPKASSLRLISGKVISTEELLHAILKHLKEYFLLLKTGAYKTIKSEYENHLFRKNKPSTFKDAQGVMFSGYIKQVSNTGKLQVLLEDDLVKEFELKEIMLLY